MMEWDFFTKAGLWSWTFQKGRDFKSENRKVRMIKGRLWRCFLSIMYIIHELHSIGSRLYGVHHSTTRMQVAHPAAPWAAESAIAEQLYAYQ